MENVLITYLITWCRITSLLLSTVSNSTEDYKNFNFTFQESEFQSKLGEGINLRLVFTHLHSTRSGLYLCLYICMYFCLSVFLFVCLHFCVYLLNHICHFLNLQFIPINLFQDSSVFVVYQCPIVSSRIFDKKQDFTFFFIDYRQDKTELDVRIDKLTDINSFNFQIQQFDN